MKNKNWNKNIFDEEEIHSFEEFYNFERNINEKIKF